MPYIWNLLDEAGWTKEMKDVVLTILTDTGLVVARSETVREWACRSKQSLYYSWHRFSFSCHFSREFHALSSTPPKAKSWERLDFSNLMFWCLTKSRQKGSWSEAHGRKVGKHRCFSLHLFSTNNPWTVVCSFKTRTGNQLASVDFKESRIFVQAPLHFGAPDSFAHSRHVVRANLQVWWLRSWDDTI